MDIQTLKEIVYSKVFDRVCTLDEHRGQEIGVPAPTPDTVDAEAYDRYCDWLNDVAWDATNNIVSAIIENNIADVIDFVLDNMDEFIDLDFVNR